MPIDAPSAVVAELAPTGALRVGVNMQNFLLVSGRDANGGPVGVSPDIGTEIARRLGVPATFVPYPSPGAVADAVERREWDVANIGAEPQRAEKIAFSPAYCEIEATYLVPPGSPIRALDEVDQPGVRIAVFGRAAYGLWLERNLERAELLRADGIDASWELFLSAQADALAGLRPRLLSDVDKLPGARLLDGKFAAVQQAIGAPKEKAAAAAWLAKFVEEAKRSGLVATLIAKHGVEGLSVAPPAT